MKNGSQGIYRNEVDKPEQASVGHMESGMGVKDFKGQAMNIAYGQAGKKGCESDQQKIRSQMMHYHNDDGAAGY